MGRNVFLDSTPRTGGLLSGGSVLKLSTIIILHGNKELNYHIDRICVVVDKMENKLFSDRRGHCANQYISYDILKDIFVGIFSTE